MTIEISAAERIRRMQDLIIARGTNKHITPDSRFNDISDEFATLRRELISSLSKRKNFPKDITEIQSLNMFWDKKLCNFSSYKERREYAYDLFKDLLIEIELSKESPLDETTSNSLSLSIIDEYWRKALERRNAEPEGAITMARTLIEATCKKNS